MRDGWAAGTCWAGQDEGIELLNADELHQWLDGTLSPVPRRDEVEASFGVGLDRALGLPFPDLARRLRFTLAVLRDAFGDDVALRGWLHRAAVEPPHQRAPCAPHRGTVFRPAGVRPIDLLRSGRFDQLESLAVREWNRLVVASAISTLP